MQKLAILVENMCVENYYKYMLFHFTFYTVFQLEAFIKIHVLSSIYITFWPFHTNEIHHTLKSEWSIVYIEG